MLPVSINYSPTDIVPLAAMYSGSNYFYCKNFKTPITTAGSTRTWKCEFTNLNIANTAMLSFQLGGDKGNPILGGVYNYNTSTSCFIDYSGVNTALPYTIGVVMFGPRSYYTGAETGLPHIVGAVANTTNNSAINSDLQLGGTCTSNYNFVFNTPLTSNLYGVYGFVSNPNSGNLYGGAIVRSYGLKTSGFGFNTFACNGNSAFNRSNFQMVAIQ